MGVARTIPLRTARKILRANGFEITRHTSHEVWADSTGRYISLPYKPHGGNLYGFLAQSIRRIERGERPSKDRVNRG